METLHKRRLRPTLPVGCRNRSIDDCWSYFSISTALAQDLNLNPTRPTTRLGQGSFRVLVTEAYERRCAITGERTLPVLDTAHIMPYSVCRKHELSNGILMRSDLHRLFDGGYLTIDPTDRKVVISRRIREEFENGKEYYRLEDQAIRETPDAAFRPLTENFEYHAYNRFR